MECPLLLPVRPIEPVNWNEAQSRLPSIHERTLVSAQFLLPSPPGPRESFAYHFIGLMQSRFSMQEAKSAIQGPQGDYYRNLAVHVLGEQNRALEAFSFLEDIEDESLKIDCFEKLAPSLALHDAFSQILTGFQFLKGARLSLCQYTTAVRYLELGYIARVINLYFLNISQIHKKRLFELLYEKASSVEDKTALANFILTAHLKRNETNEAIMRASQCAGLNTDDLLIGMGLFVIDRKLSGINPILAAISKSRRNELQSKIPSSQRTEIDSLIRLINIHIKSGLPLENLFVILKNHNYRDIGMAEACKLLVEENRTADAYNFATQIRTPHLLRETVKLLIDPIVEKDEFNLLKILFTLVIDNDSLKLYAGAAYISRNVSRSVGIYHLIKTNTLRCELFSKMMAASRTEEEKNKIVDEIAAPFLNSGDIRLAILAVKTGCPGIDTLSTIKRMGYNLIRSKKIAHISFIFNELPPEDREELESYLLSPIT